MLHDRPRVRGALALSTAVLAVTALTACNGGSSSSSNSSSAGGSTAAGGKDVLTLAQTADIQGWDPTSQPAYQGWGADAVYDNLVQCDSFGKPMPDAADTWELSADSKSVTAHLRAGMKFSDGAPVDSAAVKASFEYAGKTGGSAARFADLKFDTPDAQNITITWPDAQPTLALEVV